jgi:hypothetical protein
MHARSCQPTAEPYVTGRCHTAYSWIVIYVQCTEAQHLDLHASDSLRFQRLLG